MSETSWLLGPDRRGVSVWIEGDRVRWAGTGMPPVDAPTSVLDCSGAEIGPGRVNAHTHLYSGLAPLGMPAPEPPPTCFVEILERVWWRLDRALDAASLRASARYYVANALLAGTTTLIDHHESPELIEGSLDILADACQALGSRALLTYGATERNGGRDEGRRGLEECRRFIAADAYPLVRGAIGLHASFTVSDDTVREAGELCRELGVRLHVHLAEDGADVVDARERGYAGPLERLEALGALAPGSILPHGVHLSAEQVRRAAASDCWMVQNPRSNEGNRVGFPEHLDESPRVALGTDGYPADMPEEGRALARILRERGADPALVGPRLVGSLAMATEVLGVAFAPLGGGATADVAVIEPDGCAPTRARHVFVAGRPVVRDGRLVGADLAEIGAEAEGEAARLWERMRAL